MGDCCSWGSVRKSGLERMEREGTEEPEMLCGAHRVHGCDGGILQIWGDGLGN